jgi:hypothetical protein
MASQPAEGSGGLPESYRYRPAKQLLNYPKERAKLADN